MQLECVYLIFWESNDKGKTNSKTQHHRSNNVGPIVGLRHKRKSAFLIAQGRKNRGPFFPALERRTSVKMEEDYNRRNGRGTRITE